MKVTIAVLIGIGFFAVTNASWAGSYYGQALCNQSGFHCIPVKRSDTWYGLFPDEQERNLVMRLNRTNVELNGQRSLAVPNNLDGTRYMSLAPFSDSIEPATNGKTEVIVDLGKQAFGAYDTNGKLVYWGPVSGGKGYCPDVGVCKTATGTFKIEDKEGARCVSSKFPLETHGGAPMPYCMHFYQGFALHGSTLPGYNASHGCVRMFYDDAQWLNENFLSIGSKVVVTYGS